MGSGLFGKLPVRRDFVALGLPRPFLSLWEDWLQSAVAASKISLGNNWRAAFLTAPIWRFWIGGRVCGMTAAGAMMPSVDKVGRYFPLTLCACAPSGQCIKPPPVDTMDDWYAAVEGHLLQALDEGFEGDPVELIDGMPFPKFEDECTSEAPPSAPGQVAAISAFAHSEMDSNMQALSALRLRQSYENLTYWWTLGGNGRPPHIAVWSAMPQPYVYSGFLTGHFEP